MKKINRLLSAILILMMCFSLFSDALLVFAEELAAEQDAAVSAADTDHQEDPVPEELEALPDEPDDPDVEVITEGKPGESEIPGAVPADDYSLPGEEPTFSEESVSPDRSSGEAAGTMEDGSTTRPLSGVEITLIKDVRFLEGDSVSISNIYRCVSIV